MKKNYNHIFFIVLTVLLIVLSGCQPLEETVATQASTIDKTLPTATTVVNHLPVVISPAEDMTIICGRVIREDGSPFDNLNVRLAEVYYGEPNSEGAFVLNTASSPSAMTDQDGYFCTAEVAVTDYILIMGNPEEEYEIYPDKDMKAKIWTPAVGEVLDLGELVTTLGSELE